MTGAGNTNIKHSSNNTSSNNQCNNNSSKNDSCDNSRNNNSSSNHRRNYLPCIGGSAKALIVSRQQRKLLYLSLARMPKCVSRNNLYSSSKSSLILPSAVIWKTRVCRQKLLPPPKQASKTCRLHLPTGSRGRERRRIRLGVDLRDVMTSYKTSNQRTI